MNVLMISDVYFPRINGVSTSIETYRSALDAQGIKCLLMAPSYPHQSAVESDDLIRIPSRYLPMDPEDRMMSKMWIKRQLPMLREQHIDLIHVQTPFVAHYAGLQLARELGVPCVASYHTFFEEYLFHYIPFLPRSWMRMLARKFSKSQCNDLDQIIVPSTSMAQTLRNYGIHKPLHVLPTGLPQASFHHGDGGAFRQRYGIDAERPLLLFVGRVAHEKNIGFLIEMMQQLRRTRPDALLLITGEGPALAGLQRQVVSLGLEQHVRFLGYLERHSELHDCYRAADLFVFASKTETQGLVLLEAMALGTPVVALAEMGTRDILEPRQGCLIAPDDPTGFSTLVADILSKPAQLKSLGIQAQQYAREWNGDRLAARLADLYQIWCGRRDISAAPAFHPVTGIAY